MDIRRQKKYLKIKLEPLLKDVADYNDGSVKQDDIKRIAEYYGIVIGVLYGESFSRLRGYKMNPQERSAITSFGIITGIYDDFFDKHDLDEELLLKLTNEPETINPDRLIDRIFIRYRNDIIENTVQKDFLWQMVDKTYHSQVESRKQNNEALSQDEIKRITFDKGAYSMLLFRSVLRNDLVEGEYEALYNLGAALQLVDDIFDLYFDLQENVSTLATQAKHIGGLKDIFYDQMNTGLDYCKRMNYQRKNIRNFLYKIIPVFCQCMTCLEQLEKLEQKSGSFDPSQFTRQELVCDMEKSRSFLRAMYYYLVTRI